MYECINEWTKAKMIEHIKKEFKGKSFTDYGNGYLACLYRGANGTKCAIGMFIPDNLYSPTFESSPVGHIINTIELESKMPLQVVALSEFQRVHDRSQPETTLSDILNWIETNVKGDSNV